MLPKNKIIFWRFEVTILRKEYELLKAIINLNTNHPSEFGYTEEQIMEHVPYCQNNNIRNSLRVSFCSWNSIWRMCEGYLRISYAYSLDNLKIALSRLERFVKKLREERKL